GQTYYIVLQSSIYIQEWDDFMMMWMVTGKFMANGDAGDPYANGRIESTPNGDMAFHTYYDPNYVNPYQLDQSQPSNPTAWYIPNATEDGGVEWQSFVPTADNINRVNLSIENSGITDPTGETISVWINDEGNTLTPLVGATIDMSGLSSGTLAWYIVDLPTTPLTPGQTYYIVLQSSIYIQEWDDFMMMWMVTGKFMANGDAGNPYANGRIESTPNGDMAFHTYYDPNYVSPYQLDQSQPSNPTAWYIPNATEDGGVEWQSFVPSADNINRVNLSIENSGITGPTGETISVWINDEGNTLTPLVGATIDMSGLSSGTSAWYTVDFPTTPLTPGRTYYIVLQSSIYIQEWDDFMMMWMVTGKFMANGDAGDPYANGRIESTPNGDMAFHTYYDPNYVSPYQLDQSQPSNPTAWYIPNATEEGGVEWQSFVPTADNINRVNLSIENSGIADPTGETISVWINDEGNALTPLVGATIDMSGLSSGTSAWFVVDFLTTPIIPGQTYYIVLQSSIYIQEWDDFMMMWMVTGKFMANGDAGDPYANGRIESTPNGDMAFHTYYDPDYVPPPHTLSEPKIIYPTTGEILTGLVTITWDPAVDSHKHSILYNLSYSIDGISWYEMETDIGITSYLWDTTQVEDGSNYRIQLTAYCTEGLHTSDISQIFSIANKQETSTPPSTGTSTPSSTSPSSTGAPTTPSSTGVPALTSSAESTGESTTSPSITPGLTFEIILTLSIVVFFIQRRKS
ncbi:MAG: hypothetical protein ACFFC6_04415, partial [Promethearchaeota archaeon]